MVHGRSLAGVPIYFDVPVYPAMYFSRSHTESASRTTCLNVQDPPCRLSFGVRFFGVLWLPVVLTSRVLGRPM